MQPTINLALMAVQAGKLRPSFTGLAAQSYTLVVRDADNTANTNTLATIEITQPDQLEAVVTATSETFAGAKDGAITISSQKGGSGVYEYSINGTNWQTSEQFPGLGSGIYNVQIRDRNAPSLSDYYLKSNSACWCAYCRCDSCQCAL